MREVDDTVAKFIAIVLLVTFVMFLFSFMRPCTVPLRDVQVVKGPNGLCYTGTQEKDDGGIVIWNFSSKETVLYPVLDPGEEPYAEVTQFFFVRKVKLYVPREEGTNGEETGIH